jgi:hypothetical protein
MKAHATEKRSLWPAVGATAAAVLLLLVCFGLCLAAALLTHGGARPAPPGAPAGVTVAPAGD